MSPFIIQYQEITVINITIGVIRKDLKYRETAKLEVADKSFPKF